MRLSNDAFWGLTLRQLALLDERHKEFVKREDRRAGEIVAMIFNANRNVEEHPVGATWQDVFVEWKDPPKEQTEEEMLEVMRQFMAATNQEGLSHQHS